MVPPRQSKVKGAGGRAPAAAAPRDDDGLLLVVILAAFAIAALLYLNASPGTYQDDDLDHYFMARAAFSHPAFLIDAWGRPAFTILYALPAQLGFTAVRVMTVLITLLTGWLTARTAARLGFRSPALAAGLAVWQPLVLILSFSALVEPLAALGIAALLYFMAADKPARAALVMGLLPIARLELAVLVPIAVVWLAGRRRFGEIEWIVGPLLVWAGIGAMVHGDPLWLLHVIRGGGRPLTTTGPVHYLQNLIAVTGPTVLLGILLGFAALLTPGGGARPKRAGLVWIVGFVTLTALTWDKLPIGGSIGFLRHLVMLSPAAALLAAAAVEALTDEMPPPRRAAFLAVGILTIAVTAVFLSNTLEADYILHPEKDWMKLAGLLPPALVVLAATIRPGLFGARARRGLVIFFVVAAAAFCLVARRPLDYNGEQKIVKLVVDKIQEFGLSRGPWIANHPWFYHLMHRDRWDRHVTPYVTWSALDAAQPGVLVFWENHYGDRLYGNVAEDSLMSDSRFELLMGASSDDDVFRIRVFRKVDF